MAQLHHDSSASMAVVTARATLAPISAHPAFPALVAIWFAALFGLGMLVLPPALLERIVAATHLGAFVSAANPPLGFTARVLLAACAAGLGAAAGFWLARRLARFQADGQDLPLSASGLASGVAEERAAASRRSSGSKRPPLRVSEDLAWSEMDDQDDDEWPEATASGRSRKLVGDTDYADRDIIFTVPLPGEEERAFSWLEEEQPVRSEPLLALPDADGLGLCPEDAMPLEQAAHQPPVEAGAIGEQEHHEQDHHERRAILRAPLGELGVFGLVERLRLALETRTLTSAAITGAATASVMAAASDGGLQSFFGGAPQDRAQSRLSDDDGLSDEAGRDGADDAPDESFASLLDMTSPYRIPIEHAHDHDDADDLDEAEDDCSGGAGSWGAGKWDSQPPSPRPSALGGADDADRALREALAALRHMSGAA